MEQFITNIRKNGQKNIDRLDWTKNKFPLAHRFIRKMATAGMKQKHFGQVVPLEDAEKIIDLVQTVTRITCVCRSVTTGKNDVRYCMLLGIGSTGLVYNWPELGANLEVLTREEAKNLLRKFDNQGLIHSIWIFKTPFIGAICNCDHDCLAYHLQVSSDLMNMMFKAEYLADVELEKCIGCRNCQKLCQFGAVEYSVTGDKCYINPLKCYGCGICRNGCKKEAISLKERVEFLTGPTLRF